MNRLNSFLGLAGGILLGFGIFLFFDYAFESIAFIAESGWDARKLGVSGVFQYVGQLPQFPTKAAIVLGSGLGLLFARNRGPT